MTLGSGRVVCPSPLSGGLVVLLEFLDEQVADATLAGEVDERTGHIRVQTGGEFDLLASASDIVREVFRGSVPEVVDATLAVGFVRRLLPDFTNLVCDAVGEDATLHQTIQDLMPFLLGQLRTGHRIEGIVLTIEQRHSIVHSTRGEFDIERSRVLTHQVESRFLNHRSVIAHTSEQGDNQRHLHTPIKRITDDETEFEIIFLNLHPDIAEGVGSEHPRSVLRDIDLAFEVHPLALEDGFGSLDEVGVLDDVVAFRDSLQAHARVLANIPVERGGRTIGQVEAFLRDRVERVVRHLGFGFGGIRDLVFHMRVCFGFEYDP